MKKIFRNKTEDAQTNKQIKKEFLLDTEEKKGAIHFQVKKAVEKERDGYR